MKSKVQFIIFLLFGLTSLVYLFPFIFVEAAKLESGVTINGTPTPETEKICDDQMDNDNDGKIDADDEDCAAAPAGPATTRCELKIESLVPINYGQLNPGQDSQPQGVGFRNVGSDPATILVKGGDWISDVTGKPVAGPEITDVRRSQSGDKVPLKTYPFEFGSQVPAGGLAVLWYHVKVPVSGFSGSLHQELSIDLKC